MPVGDRTRQVDEGLDLLVIAGDGRSSKPIEELSTVTARLRTLRSTMPLTSTATNRDQRRALTTLLAHIHDAWTAATSMAPSHEDIRALLRVLAIEVLDLHDAGADRATALAHLRSALLDPAHDTRTWRAPTDLGRTLSEQRAWRRRSDIAADLDTIGAPWDRPAVIWRRPDTPSRQRDEPRGAGRAHWAASVGRTGSL